MSTLPRLFNPVRRPWTCLFPLTPALPCPALPCLPPARLPAVEQVLDPRTRMVLFKMLNRGVFSEINGCVSTGKEANVYHASSAGTAGTAGQPGTPAAEMAIKVYKTAILVFKDRDR